MERFLWVPNQVPKRGVTSGHAERYWTRTRKKKKWDIRNKSVYVGDALAGHGSQVAACPMALSHLREITAEPCHRTGDAGVDMYCISIAQPNYPTSGVVEGITSPTAAGCMILDVDGPFISLWYRRAVANIGPATNPPGINHQHHPPSGQP